MVMSLVACNPFVLIDSCIEPSVGDCILIQVPARPCNFWLQSLALWIISRTRG
jgi:hypothetical protein